MDNDPSQTSKVAMAAIKSIEANLLRIPVRSPDLNPIDNVFHLVKSGLGTKLLCNLLKLKASGESTQGFKGHAM